MSLAQCRSQMLSLTIFRLGTRSGNCLCMVQYPTHAWCSGSDLAEKIVLWDLCSPQEELE